MKITYLYFLLILLASCDPEFNETWIIDNRTNSDAILYYYGFYDRISGEYKPDTIFRVADIQRMTTYILEEGAQAGKSAKSASAPRLINIYDSVIFDFPNEKKIIYKPNMPHGQKNYYNNEFWELIKIDKDEYQYMFRLSEDDLLE